MRDRLLVELIAAVQDETQCKDVSDALREKFSYVLSKYEISKLNTELQVIPQYPEEVKMYLVSRSIDGLAASTVAQYQWFLERFFRTMQKKLSDIDTNDIRAYLYWYKKTFECSDRYLDWIRVCISAFMEWCVNNSFLLRNPCRGISKIKYVENLKGFLTQEELEDIRNHCNTARERAIIEVLYSTAVRCNELTTIKMVDVDIEARTLIVHNQKGKRYKTCYLNDKAVYWVKKYLASRQDADSEYLFARAKAPYQKLCKGGVESIISRIMTRCNLNKHVTPNTFRHTTATQGLNNGMSLAEVQHMLDHRNPATTLIYATLQEESLQASHRKAII